jgi:glycosyltransferase involved in cell wall biosynthesis
MGQQCRVLNIQPRAVPSGDYIKISGAASLIGELFKHTLDDWTLSVHTNGHNPKSWLISLLCAMAAQFGPGATLTLHSGMTPEYLRNAKGFKRAIARLTCLMYDKIVCVNEDIAEAVRALNTEGKQIEVKPAFVPLPAVEQPLPQALRAWMHSHPSFISVTLSFRPEYGFEFLLQALRILRRRRPELGCLIMGGGEGRTGAEELVKANAVQGTVFLAGDLEHQLCLTAISRSTAFVRPTFRDGDSISVREALSLGVPVVASDVGTRPKGTLLFEAGDVEGLIAQLEKALVREERAEKRQYA